MRIDKKVPLPLPIRAEWSSKIMALLYSKAKEGHIPLNDFAVDILGIKPNDTDAGVEFDQTLQGMENLGLLFYKPTETTPGGFSQDKRCLANVSFSAVLLHEGWRIIVDQKRDRNTKNLAIASIIVALASAFGSFLSAAIQAKDTTDTQLLRLNTQLQKPLQTLDSLQQFQKGIDASLRQIKDSLDR